MQWLKRFASCWATGRNIRRDRLITLCWLYEHQTWLSGTHSYRQTAAELNRRRRVTVTGRRFTQENVRYLRQLLNSAEYADFHAAMLVAHEPAKLNARAQDAWIDKLLKT